MLTICVPYRDRADHLKIFVPQVLSVVPFANILVIEQEKGKPFNRGKLLNVGFSLMDKETTHFCIHDVDMIPFFDLYLSDKNKILHLATKVEQFKYKMPYYNYFGGVNVFPVELFNIINGFCNEFWGWGSEDDDLLKRCENNNLEIKRVNGIFRSLKHEHALKSAISRKMHRKNSHIFKNQTHKDSGLSNCNYTVLSENQEPTHRVVVVSI